MHLQGADARGQFENAVELLFFQPQHQRVGAETQPQVQFQRAVLHQQVAVAGGAVDHLRAVFLFVQPVQDRRGHGGRGRSQRRRTQVGQAGVLFRRQTVGVVQAERHEADAVAGLELAQLPAVRGDHRGRTHKATQGGAVRPQDHRHVAGEIHGAHGVGVVVNVGRVHARFAAVAARPLRFRAHQADAGAAGVVVHLPVGAEEGGHVVVGEKVRRAVGAVDHAQFPVVAQGGLQAVGHGRRGVLRCAAGCGRLGIEVQHVAGADGAPAMAAELPQGEGAARAQVGLALQAAGEGQIGAGAVALHLAQLEGLAGGDGNRLVAWQRLAVQGGAHVRAGEGDAGAVVEAQGRAVEGEFQAGGVLGVAQQAVAEPEAERVEGAGRRHADRPVAAPARVVLHRGQGAAGEHVQGGGVVVEIVQVAGGHLAVLEHPVGEDRQHIVAVGFDAFHAGVFQGALQGGQRRFAVVFEDDQLGQHRVVQRRHRQARFDPMIDAQLLAVGFGERGGGEQAGVGLEILVGVFRVQARLQRMAARLETLAQGGQGRQLAGGQLHHPAHQVDAEHLLGDAVLHLQAGVHFQKVEAVAVLIEDELHGAGVAVIHRRHQAAGGVVQGGAHVLRQVGGRGFFQHFLVAALGGAVAFTQRQRAAGAVAEHLHFDVAGALNVFFQEHAVVGEVVGAQAAHAVPGFFQAGVVVADLHADAAAAGGALEHHRVADVRGGLQRRRRVIQKAGAGQQRYVVVFRQGAGGVFQAEVAHLLRGGPDESDAVVFAALHEFGVFTEKAVAGVYRVDAVFGHQREQLVLVQVGLRGVAVAQVQRLVRQGHVSGFGVRVGVDRHAGHVQILEGTDDAGGDGAAVGNQNLVEHDVGSLARAGRPAVVFPCSGVVPGGVFNQHRYQISTSMGVGL